MHSSKAITKISEQHFYRSIHTKLFKANSRHERVNLTEVTRHGDVSSKSRYFLTGILTMLLLKMKMVFFPTWYLIPFMTAVSLRRRDLVTFWRSKEFLKDIYGRDILVFILKWTFLFICLKFTFVEISALSVLMCVFQGSGCLNDVHVLKGWDLNKVFLYNYLILYLADCLHPTLCTLHTPK